MSELALQLIEKEKQEKTGKLDLGKCGLTDFSEELFELTWLEELSLSNKVLSENLQKWIESENKGPVNHLKGSLPDKFQAFTLLKKLSISGSNRSDIYIIDALVLGKISGLQSLYHSDNQISDYSFLEKLTGLHSLYLSSNKIRDIRFLEKLTGLQTLY